MKKLRRNKNPADFDAEHELVRVQQAGRSEDQEEITRKLSSYYAELQALQRKEMNDGTSEIHLQG